MANVTRWGEIRELLPPLLPVGAGGVPIVPADANNPQLIQTTPTAGLETILTALLNQSQPFTLAWVGIGKYTDGWFLAGLADATGATYTYFDVHLATSVPGHVSGVLNPSGGPANDIRHQSTKLRTYLVWRSGTNISFRAGYKTAVSLTGVGAAANANGRLGLGDIVSSYATVKHRAVLMVIGRAGDANDIASMLRWARTYQSSVSGASKVLLGEGDSITQGFQGTGVDDDSWMTRACDAAPLLAIDNDNYATAGAGIIGGGSSIGLRTGLIDAYLAAHPATTPIVSLWAGTNDVAGGQTGADAATANFAWLDARKAAKPSLQGIIWTMLARDAAGPGSSVTQAAMNAGRTALNTGIRAGIAARATWLRLVDIANDANFLSDASYASAYMLADHVHLNPTGQAYVATLAAGIVAPI